MAPSRCQVIHIRIMGRGLWEKGCGEWGEKGTVGKGMWGGDEKGTVGEGMRGGG